MAVKMVNTRAVWPFFFPAMKLDVCEKYYFQLRILSIPVFFCFCCLYLFIYLFISFNMVHDQFLMAELPCTASLNPCLG